MAKDEKRPQLEPRKRLSLRMRDAERRLVELAAHQRGLTFSEYLRNAGTEAARKDLGR